MCFLVLFVWDNFPVTHNEDVIIYLFGILERNLIGVLSSITRDADSVKSQQRCLRVSQHWLNASTAKLLHNNIGNSRIAQW